jgi:1,2-diacylglycerol 3-alpha-glucosyltransferase
MKIVFTVVLICPGEKIGLIIGENGLKLFTIPSAGKDHALVSELNQFNVYRLYKFLDAFHPDIVHAHEPTSISLVSQVWAIQHRVPFVYTAHVLVDRILDFGAKDMVGIFNFKLTESFLNDYFNTFLFNCDAVIALNKSVEESLDKVGYKNLVFRIPNGRNLGLYTACQFANVNSNPKILTFIGSLVPRKNQMYLLDMLKYLPDNYVLQLLGSSLVPHDEKELRDYCRAHRLENRVIFAGEVPHNDIPKWLEKTHVFVSASIMEVQSLVVLESLASGRPVVGLSNETIDEVIDDQVGANLSKEASPHEFAREVLRICGQTPDQYLEMCVMARQRVENLDWSNVMKTTIDAYNQLIHTSTLRDEQSEVRMAKMLNFIASQKVRDILTQRLPPMRPRINSRTWIYSTLTIFLSAATYLAIKLFTQPGKKK